MHHDNQLQKDVNELLTILFNSSNPNETVKKAAELILNENTKGGDDKMQNVNNTTETQTQQQADVEKDLDLFDIADTLDIAQLDFENVRTLLEEMANDLCKEIKFDGTKEDKQRKDNLLNRRPVLERFLNMSMDYVIKLQDTIQETVNDLHAYIKSGGSK